MKRGSKGTKMSHFRFIQWALKRNKRHMTPRRRALRADKRMGSDGWVRPAWQQYKVPVGMFRTFMLSPHLP